MTHSSIRLEMPCEFINVTPLNPLISKCHIKVCYVDEKANRNQSVITKDTAKKLANSLPGSPIVGYYNEEIDDFDEHTKGLKFNEDGLLTITSKTRPYGFVDLNARCWFQKYLDDGVTEREYLMTEGYLWTGQYPECKRVIDQGNNQSMELSEQNLDAYWTKDINGNPRFFIINDGLISKLCILGNDQEPCFEGATISEPKIEFKLDNDFKEELQQMIYQLQEFLTKGGPTKMEDKEKNMIPNEYKKEDDKDKEKDKKEQEETKKIDDNTKDTSKKDEEEKKKKTEFLEEKCEKCGKPLSQCTCEKKEYSLEEIPEYTSLKAEFSLLQSKYEDLVQKTNDLTQSLTSLQEFKAIADKKEKQAMIDQFYMLSDKDKEDVVKNIDTYSLEDIENKLSVICFRNKVNFDTENKDNNSQQEKPTTYTLNNSDMDTVPAWVRAVAATQENM